MNALYSILMRALVLSGGGLFGAWQAGAWSVAARHFTPDLIVGCSIGAVNGYFIAAGGPPEQLVAMWRSRERTDLRHLHASLQELARRPLRTAFALTLTDLLRLRPHIVSGEEVTWRHLAASCAVPFLLPQVKIGGRWYSDGGLLNPLPVWAAVALGADDILALDVLPEFPAVWLRPAVRLFRAAFGYHPPVPAGVKLVTLSPSRRLGGLCDTLRWDAARIERWLELGARDTENHFRVEMFRA